MTRQAPSSLAADKIITVANPAAGAGLSAVVTAGKHWGLRTVRFDLTTNGSAANRLVSLSLTAPGDTVPFWKWEIGINHTATKEWSYYFTDAIDDQVDRSAALNAVYAPLPDDLIIPAGTTIAVAVAAVNAADQINDVRLHVVEYG